jgi:hypothetical protein
MSRLFEMLERFRKHLGWSAFGTCAAAVSADVWLFRAHLSVMVLAVAWVGYASRSATHFVYHPWRGSDWRIRSLVAIELLLTAACAWAVQWLWGKGAPATFGICLLMAALVIITSRALTLALRDAELKPASTRFPEGRLGCYLNELCVDWGIAGHESWVSERPPLPSGSPRQARPSTMLRAIVGALIAALAVSGPAAIAQIAGVTPKVDRSASAPAAGGSQSASAHEASRRSPRDPSPMSGSSVPASGPIRSHDHAAPPPVNIWLSACGIDEPAVDHKVPDVQSHSLARAFETLGPRWAGCPNRVIHAGGSRDAWVLTGSCDGTLYSAAVATSDGSWQLIYGELPTAFVRDLASRQLLISAEARAEIPGGGAVILRTTSGPYLFVQQGGPPLNPTSCRQVAETTSGYIGLPPSLARSWMTLIQEGFAWPRELPSETYGQRQLAFVPDGSSGPSVATARCSGWSCTMRRVDGTVVPRSPAVDLDAIKSLAEAGP